MILKQRESMWSLIAQSLKNDMYNVIRTTTDIRAKPFGDDRECPFQKLLIIGDTVCFC